MLLPGVVSVCGLYAKIHEGVGADWVGLTPQYKDLQALHEKYESKGLKIIGFPCNQVSQSLFLPLSELEWRLLKNVMRWLLLFHAGIKTENDVERCVAD